MLSSADRSFYREQGYLVVPDVLEPGTLDEIRRDLARILAGARAVKSHTARAIASLRAVLEMDK